MNLQEELKELKQRIAELEELSREFPQDGDEYYVLSATGLVIPYVWVDDNIDFKSQAIGNIFRTKERAEFAVEKLKVEAELRKFSRPFNYGWDNYNIILTDNESVNTAYWSGVQSQGSIHFESRDKAQQAIESVGEDRIKKYIFGVED